MMFAIRELTLVIIDWLSGNGDLADLLYAWAEVICGRVEVDDPARVILRVPPSSTDEEVTHYA